jgi:hypothetical protein
MGFHSPSSRTAIQCSPRRSGRSSCGSLGRSSTCRPPFTRRRTARSRPPTESSSCTCDASPAIAPGSGFVGCHGRSTHTTPPTSHHSATLCFVWSMAGTPPRPSAPMSPARPASQQSPRRWRSARPSLTTSAIAFNRHKRSRSASTTSTTGRCPSGSAIGLFFAFGSGQQHPFHAQQQGSSSRGTSARTR